MTTVRDIITAELALAYDAGPKYTRESVYPFTMGDTTYQTLGDAVRSGDVSCHIRHIFEFQKKNPAVAEIVRQKHFYVLPELPEASGNAVHFLRRGIRMKDPTWLQLVNSCLVSRCQELEQMNEALQKHVAQTRTKALMKTGNIIPRIDIGVQAVPAPVARRDFSENTDSAPDGVDEETLTDPIEPEIQYIERIIEVPVEKIVHEKVFILPDLPEAREFVEPVRVKEWADVAKPTWGASINKQNGKPRRTNVRLLETYDGLFTE